MRKVRFDSEKIKSGTKNKTGNVKMYDLFKVIQTTHKKKKKTFPTLGPSLNTLLYFVFKIKYHKMNFLCQLLFSWFYLSISFIEGIFNITSHLT